MTIKDQIIRKIFTQCEQLYNVLKAEDPDIEKIQNSEIKQLNLEDADDSLGQDLIVFNNSFMYRDKLKTAKSDKYLGLLRTPPKSENDIVVVIPNNTINSDWKFISFKSGNYPTVIPLKKSINESREQFGKIAFILIGNFGELSQPSINISLENIKRVMFDSSVEVIEINNDTVAANPTNDDRVIWEGLISSIQLDEIKQKKYKQVFLGKLTELRKELILPLEIPDKLSDLENTFLDVITNKLQNEITQYEQSLIEWLSDSSDQVNYNNILRIAYNFSDDAVKLLRLIISVSDLKPLLFWMTIFSQYKLKSEFDKLSWESTTKPSLNEYDGLIKGARNSRFHNLFNVKNTVSVELNGINLRALNFTLFSEYIGRGQTNNVFEYEDKQLIDVLSEFTRTSEKTVSEEFWSQNLQVMKATLILVNDICDSLKLLCLLS